MTARWLDDVLARHGLVLSSAQIDALATDIREALPIDAYEVAGAIRESARTVLVQRGFAADEAIDIAHECGNNAAQSVVFLVMLGRDDEECEVAA